KKDLRADLVRVLVAHLGSEPDDAILQQPVEDTRRDQGFSHFSSCFRVSVIRIYRRADGRSPVFAVGISAWRTGAPHRETAGGRMPQQPPSRCDPRSLRRVGGLLRGRLASRGLLRGRLLLGLALGLVGLLRGSLLGRGLLRGSLLRRLL